MKKKILHNEEKSFQKIGRLIFDHFRSRLITVIVSAAFGAIVGIYSTIVTVQPQLVSVTSKVEAIENQYVSKQDFEAFQETEKVRWEALVYSLGIKQSVSSQ